MKDGPQDKILVYAPANAGQAARFFRECSRMREGGRKLRVGILESPFGPPCDFCVKGLEGMARSGDPAEAVRHPSAAEGGSTGNIHTAVIFKGLEKKTAHMVTNLDELLKIMETDGGGGGINVFVTHRKMDRILEVSERDLLAVVQGGAGFTDFKRAVEEAGYNFPYDPFIAGDDTTVAGIIMGGDIAGSDGRFGGLREYLLRAEIVTPRGDVIHGGSRSVKDVGGYEILGFLMGSGGRCGMISSAALKLVPAPGSRMFFTVRGDPSGLKDSAQRVHRKMRPAFLEIFEGEAAGMLAAEFRRLGPGLDHPVLEEDGPPALLLGELQSPGADTGDALARSVSSVLGGGIPLLRLDSSMHAARERFPYVVLEALDGGLGVIHLSYDAGPQPPRIPGALIYRSLYPERIHCLIPCDPAAISGPEMGAAGVMRSVPGFRDFIAAMSGMGLRERVELIFECNGNPVRLRVNGREFQRCVAGEDVSEDRWENRRVLEELNEGVLKVFDPQGLMME